MRRVALNLWQFVWCGNMSYYLCFKKKGVQIYNTSRSTRLYEVLSPMATWESWHKVTKENLYQGKESAKHKIEYLKKQIGQYETALEGCNCNFSERLEIVGEITSMKEDIRYYEVALVQINMLIDIWDEPDIFDDENHEPTLLEWGIF
jgi:hypothetical protein